MAYENNHWAKICLPDDWYGKSNDYVQRRERAASEIDNVCEGRALRQRLKWNESWNATG